MKTIISIKLPVILFFLAALQGCTKSNDKKPNYTNFKILQVTLKTMPFLNENGNAWDFFDGPDVFFNMEGAAVVLYNGTDARYDNVSRSGLPLVWDLINAHAITNLEVTQFVTVYDYDPLDQNDRIGFVGFTMNEHKSSYPKTITKASGDLLVTIRGEWY